MFEELDLTRFRGELVAIATGGTSREREISLKTGQAFEKALRARGYDLRVYDVASDLHKLANDQPAVALLGIHGGLGERGALQGFLESLAIPYTGSGVMASALAMDKDRTRIVCKAQGVPVAKGRKLTTFDLERPEDAARAVAEEFNFPLIAKLNDSGSSFGVHLCGDENELREALPRLRPDLTASSSAGVLIESLLEGPEFSVGFFDDQCLGVMEIIAAREFYDFEAKYESGDTIYRLVEDSAICEPLIHFSRLALEAVGCRGVARVDFKGDPRKPGQAMSWDFGMLEVNTIPGMTATSLVPKLAAEKGVSFTDFVEAMVAAARLDDR